MIDHITIERRALTLIRAKDIAERNHLESNTEGGVPWWNNKKIKNLEQAGGVYIKIDTSLKLEVETSLHKYFNKRVRGTYGNWDLFDMVQAGRAMDMLEADKHLPPDCFVTAYEIGLNLVVREDCSAYLDRMLRIGLPGDERKIYVNPKFKDERVHTTVFTPSTRKYYKAYDKIFEMADKKARGIPGGNILRIETVRKRVEKTTVRHFFSTANVRRLVEDFFRDWRTLRFTQDIQTPPGTGRAKQAIIADIIRLGAEGVLRESRERHKSGALKDWEYRNIKYFIRHEYDTIKADIRLLQSPEEKEYRALLAQYYPLMRTI